MFRPKFLTRAHAVERTMAGSGYVIPETRHATQPIADPGSRALVAVEHTDGGDLLPVRVIIPLHPAHSAQRVLAFHSEIAPTADDPARTFILRWSTLAAEIAAAASHQPILQPAPAVSGVRDVASDGDAANNKVLVGVPRTYRVAFTRAVAAFSSARLGSELLTGASAPVLVDGGTAALFTASATISSVDILFTHLAATVGAGGAVAESAAFSVTPVAALSVVRLEAAAAEGVAVTRVVRHAAHVAHRLVVSKPLAVLSQPPQYLVRAGSASGTALTSPGSLVLGSVSSFSGHWQADEFSAGDGVGELVVCNVRDADGFFYTSISFSVTVVTRFDEYADEEFVAPGAAGTVVAAHFDVEPHTLAEWTSDRDGTANQFLDMLSGCAARLGGKIPLVTDAPVWFDSVPVTRGGTTRVLSERIIDIVDVYNVLAFRDSAASILADTASERAYAAAAGKKYSLSVETDTNLGGEPLSITFGDETAAYLESQLRVVHDSAASADGAAFAGLAVHTWGLYRKMLLSSAGLAPDADATVALSASAATAVISAGAPAPVRDVYEWNTDLADNAGDRAAFFAAVTAGALSSAVRAVYFGSNNIVPFSPSATCTFVNAAAAAGKKVHLLYGGHTTALSANHAAAFRFCDAARTYAAAGRVWTAEPAGSSEFLVLSAVAHTNAASATTRRIWLSFTGGTRTAHRVRVVLGDVAGATYPSGRAYTSLANGSTLDGAEYGGTPETDSCLAFAPAAVADALAAAGSLVSAYVSFTTGAEIRTQVFTFTLPLATE